MALYTNLICQFCTKHVELDLLFMRDMILQNKLTVLHIPSYEQPVDIFTNHSLLHNSLS